MSTDGKHRVLIALSGGVDSAVAAHRLLEQGYEVSAAYMRTWMNEEGSDILADCPWEEDIAQAQAVCKHLGIPFEVVDLIQAYRERVVSYLVDGYRRGITPNPDVMCNREMKFGVFSDFATKNGFEYVATGHYCRKRVNADGTCDLLEGLDPNKDQSYFLALVRQEQLRRALFPIGDLHKPQVRQIAQAINLPNARRKDSQGICFLGKVDINAFLRQYIPDRPGPILRATDGRHLGEHKGLHHFTLGQRQGIGIPSNTDNEHYVVVGKDFDNNTLLIAFDHTDAPGLWGSEFLLRDLSWVNGPVTAPTDALLARGRYRDPAVPIRFTPLAPDGQAARSHSEAIPASSNTPCANKAIPGSKTIHSSSNALCANKESHSSKTSHGNKAIHSSKTSHGNKATCGDEATCSDQLTRDAGGTQTAGENLRSNYAGTAAATANIAEIFFSTKATAAATARIVFAQPQRALATGQVCALYEGQVLRGGGFYI